MIWLLRQKLTKTADQKRVPKKLVLCRMKYKETGARTAAARNRLRVIRSLSQSRPSTGVQSMEQTLITVAVWAIMDESKPKRPRMTEKNPLYTAILQNMLA